MLMRFGRYTYNYYFTQFEIHQTMAVQSIEELGFKESRNLIQHDLQPPQEKGINYEKSFIPCDVIFCCYMFSRMYERLRRFISAGRHSAGLLTLQVWNFGASESVQRSCGQDYCF
jgi:hypothetical protein